MLVNFLYYKVESEKKEEIPPMVDQEKAHQQKYFIFNNLFIITFVLTTPSIL